MAIHPTGSLGLSVARDGSLRMWDLGCAKLAARVHLKGAEASMVDFTAEGDEYILATDKKVAVHAAEGCEEVIQFKHEKRVLCMAQSKVGTSFLRNVMWMASANQAHVGLLGCPFWDSKYDCWSRLLLVYHSHLLVLKRRLDASWNVCTVSPK